MYRKFLNDLCFTRARARVCVCLPARWERTIATRLPRATITRNWNIHASDESVNRTCIPTRIARSFSCVFTRLPATPPSCPCRLSALDIAFVFRCSVSRECHRIFYLSAKLMLVVMVVDIFLSPAREGRKILRIDWTRVWIIYEHIARMKYFATFNTRFLLWKNSNKYKYLWFTIELAVSLQVQNWELVLIFFCFFSGWRSTYYSYCNRPLCSISSLCGGTCKYSTSNFIRS